MDSEVFTKLEIEVARGWISEHGQCHDKADKGCWARLTRTALYLNLDESRLKQAITTVLVMRALDG